MREKKENDMNKKTKLLLVLLSSTALTAGAFGLAACSGEAHNEEYYAQYQQYVSATAEGEVLSYEDWLIGILEDAKGEKGEKGDKGDTGEAGKAGTQWTVGESDPAATSGADGDFYLNKTTFDVYNKVNGTWTKIGSIKGSDGAAGATGNGIDTIVYKGGALEVSLTSGDKITVALPDEITHVHTYGENITVVVPSTLENEGIGYKKCTQNGCEHIELVVIPIPKYSVTVTYAGAPLADANVTISGDGIAEEGSVSGKTDQEGKLELNVLELGEYTVSVDGYTVIGSSTTSATTTDMAVEVAKNMKTEVNGWGDTTYSVEESGTYAVTVTSGEEEWWPGYSETYINAQYVSLVAGEENVNFKVTLLSEEAVFDNTSGVGEDGSYQEIVRAGETGEVTCNIDQLYFDNGKYEYGDSITYAIKVERLEAPAEGSIPELAFDGSALTSENGITATAGADEWVYYTWTNSDGGYKNLDITLGENTQLVFTTYIGYENIEQTVTESGVLKISDFNFSHTYAFKVKSSTGNISISADLYAYKGEKYNPEDLTLDTEMSGKVSSSVPKYYYKWTAEEAGNYTLVVSGASTAEVYSDASYSDEYMLLNIQSDRGVFAAEAGKTYYFAAGTTNVSTATEYQILLRKTTAEDAGSSAAYPVALTAESSLSFDNFKGTRYYTYENSSEEAVTFKLVTAGNEDTSVSVGYYSDSTFSWSSNIGSGSVAVTVEAGQTIYVLLEVYAQPNNFTGTATVEIGVPEPPVEPEIPDGVEPGEIKIPSGGNALESAGYWQITLTAEDWSDSYGYYEKRLNFIGEAGTYTITCQTGATMTDMYGEPVTTIESTGSPVRLYLDADKAGDYIITITAVTEEA